MSDTQKHERRRGPRARTTDKSRRTPSRVGLGRARLRQPRQPAAQRRGRRSGRRLAAVVRMATARRRETDGRGHCRKHPPQGRGVGYGAGRSPWMHHSPGPEGRLGPGRARFDVRSRNRELCPPDDQRRQAPARDEHAGQPRDPEAGPLAAGAGWIHGSARVRVLAPARLRRGPRMAR